MRRRKTKQIQLAFFTSCCLVFSSAHSSDLSRCQNVFFDVNIDHYMQKKNTDSIVYMATTEDSRSYLNHVIEKYFTKNQTIQSPLSKEISTMIIDLSKTIKDQHGYSTEIYSLVIEAFKKGFSNLPIRTEDLSSFAETRVFIWVEGDKSPGIFIQDNGLTDIKILVYSNTKELRQTLEKNKNIGLQQDSAIFNQLALAGAEWRENSESITWQYNNDGGKNHINARSINAHGKAGEYTQITNTVQQHSEVKLIFLSSLQIAFSNLKSAEFKSPSPELKERKRGIVIPFFKRKK